MQGYAAHKAQLTVDPYYLNYELHAKAKANANPNESHTRWVCASDQAPVRQPVSLSVSQPVSQSIIRQRLCLMDSLMSQRRRLMSPRIACRVGWSLPEWQIESAAQSVGNREESKVVETRLRIDHTHASYVAYFWVVGGRTRMRCIPICRQAQCEG